MAKKNGKQERTASLGFEAKMWEAADLLRNNMDPAEYKHVVLGLLFLKYIEDAFEERRAELRAAVADPDSDYYVEDEDEREGNGVPHGRVGTHGRGRRLEAKASAD